MPSIPTFVSASADTSPYTLQLILICLGVILGVLSFLLVTWKLICISVAYFDSQAIENGITLISQVERKRPGGVSLPQLAAHLKREHEVKSVERVIPLPLHAVGKLPNCTPYPVYYGPTSFQTDSRSFAPPSVSWLPPRPMPVATEYRSRPLHPNVSSVFPVHARPARTQQPTSASSIESSLPDPQKELSAAKISDLERATWWLTKKPILKPSNVNHSNRQLEMTDQITHMSTPIPKSVDTQAFASLWIEPKRQRATSRQQCSLPKPSQTRFSTFNKENTPTPTRSRQMV